MYCLGWVLHEKGKGYLFFHLVTQPGRDSGGKAELGMKAPTIFPGQFFAWLLLQAGARRHCGICFALPTFLFALWEGGAQT